MLALGMAVCLAQDGIGAILFMDSLDLIGQDSRSFIPGNPLIFTLTSVLGISFTVGVPVYPLRGRECGWENKLAFYKPGKKVKVLTSAWAPVFYHFW